MKWLILNLMVLSSAANASADYKCQGYRTPESIIESRCYEDVIRHALNAVRPLSSGHRISQCYVETAVGAVDPTARQKMINRYGNYPVEFVDFYVSTVHAPGDSGTDKFNPNVGAFVVRVKAVTTRSDGVPFCVVSPKAEIVGQKK